MDNLKLIIIIIILVVFIGAFFIIKRNPIQKEHFNGYNDRVLRNKNAFWGHGPDGYNRSQLDSGNLLGKGGERYMGLFYSVEEATEFARKRNISAFTLHGSSLGEWANTAWTNGTMTVSEFEDRANRYSLNDVYSVIVDTSIQDSPDSENNTAFCKVRCDDQFEVYYDNQMITNTNQLNPGGQRNWEKVLQFTIPNVKPNTDIWFHCSNLYGPGSFIAEIKIGDKITTTNMTSTRAEGMLITLNNNNKRIGGKYMGCFGDSHQQRDFEQYIGKVNNSAECAKAAYNNGKRYYGLQYGEHCWVSNRYGEYGRANNCNMKNNKSGEIFGGNNANSVYDINEKPTLIEVPAGDKSAFHSSAKALWVNKPNQYGKVDFAIRMPDVNKLNYCPDPDYEEFNPAACKDPFNCAQTSYPNFISNQNTCGSKFDYSNYYKVYKELGSAWEIVGSVESKIRTQIESSFDMVRDDISNCNGSETVEKEPMKHLVMKTDVLNTFKLKTDPSNPGLNWVSGFLDANVEFTKLLKPIAERLNYPIDPEQLTPNGDVVPDMPLYYSLIDKAIRYISTTDTTLKEQFIVRLKSLVNFARIINGNPKQVRECDCLDYSNRNTRQCLPC